MPLKLDIDNLCLGHGSDDEGDYLYLLDNTSSNNMRFLGGIRYLRHEDHLESKNMVSDGYGPTLSILLAQEARRLGLNGVTPDTNENSDEAIAMVAKMTTQPLPGVDLVPTTLLRHADSRLNVMFSVQHDLVQEAKARRRFQTHQGKGLRGWWFRRRNPLHGQAAMWLEPRQLLRFMKDDYLRQSNAAFR